MADRREGPSFDARRPEIGKESFHEDVPTNPSGYLRHVDGLRALAVLPVVIYHAGLAVSMGRRSTVQMLRGGFFGVDVFFVISGYLITGLLAKEYAAEGTISLAKFYERRLRRIGPCLMTVLAACTFLASILLDPTQQVDYASSLIASLLSLSNHYWWSSLAQYEAESSQLRPLLHTWSLACEEQYYLVVPVAFLVTMRCWGSRGTVLVLSVAGALSFGLANLWEARDSMKAFYLLPSRFWELAIGGVLALLTEQRSTTKSSPFTTMLTYLGMGSALFSFLFLPFGMHHPGLFTLPSILSACLLIAFCDTESIPGRILCSQFMVSIGKVSYSLYLWHVPLFAFGRIWIMLLEGGDKVLLVAISVGLSYLSFAYVETPFRNRELMPTRRCLAFVLGLAVLLLIWSGWVLMWFGTSMTLLGGRKGRIRLDAAAGWGSGKNQTGIEWMEDTALDWPKVEELYHMPVSDNENLFLQTLPARIKPHSQQTGGGDMFSTDPSSLKVLVVGDSFSMNLFNALYMHKDLYSRLNIEFARYGTGPGLKTSNPTGSIGRGSGSHAKLEALRYSEEDFRVANVVIFSWRWRYMDNFEQPLQSLCNIFSGVENKTIILAGKRPEFAIQQGGDFDQITELYWKYQTSHGFSAAGMNRFFFENANFFLGENAFLREQAENCSIKFLDWKSVVCELLYKECLGVTPDGMPIYQSDGAHWSLGGFKAFGLKLYNLDWFGLRSLASLASDLNN